MMKKVLAMLLAAAMMFSLAACGGSSSSSAASTDAASSEAGSSTEASSEEGSSEEASSGESDVARIQAAGELVMLTNCGFPPFEYIDGTEPAGVDVDICAAIAEELGVELRVVDMDFDGVINALVSGKGDIIGAGMTITEERLQSVDFSDVYFTSAQYMILPPDSTIASLADLAGKSIGVQTGTTGDLFIDGEISDGALKDTGATLKQYKTGLEASLDLLNGRLDVVVLDQFPAQTIVSQNEGALKLSDGAINDSESYALAVNKGSDLLPVVNEVLAGMLEDGSIDELVTFHTENTADAA